MTASRPQGFFITGTDTGVGKTLIACALLHACAARGLRAAGMKPVASGARRVRGALCNEDVESLTAASNVTASRAHVNPYCFEPPIAPHIAARLAGARIELSAIERAYRSLAVAADIVVVEGVGGFRVPLNERADTGDLAARLELPVVLVVGMRLGCLNHALLTANAIAASGLELAGWVANCIDPEMRRLDGNIAALAERLPAPLVATLPWEPSATPESNAHRFDLDALGFAKLGSKP